MIFIIIAINLSITLLNIYIAIRIWQLKELTVRISKILTNYTVYFAFLLQTAPKVMYQGQNKVSQISYRYHQIQSQTIKVKQLIWLLNQSYRIWRLNQ